MKKNKISLSTKFIVLFLLIVSLNALAYYFMLQNIYRQELKSQAKTVVSNVESFGAWVAQHGRVWIKEGSKESFLAQELYRESCENEDEQSYVHFYSKNPALAQREFSEVVAKSSSPAKFHMTSQNVMNPVNAPDSFETTALEIATKSGAEEYSEFVNGQYRFAQTIYHKASCIVCHGDPAKAPEDVIKRYGSERGFGFKEGDVAGVISVSIPANPLYMRALNFVGVREVLLIIVPFLIALWFVRTAVISPIRKLTETAHEVSTGRDTTVDTTGIDLNTHNEIHQLTLALSRMRNSTQLAMKKMREARAEMEKHRKS
jgi:HAMP domain-containing protein